MHHIPPVFAALISRANKKTCKNNCPTPMNELCPVDSDVGEKMHYTYRPYGKYGVPTILTVWPVW